MQAPQLRERVLVRVSARVAPSSHPPDRCTYSASGLHGFEASWSRCSRRLSSHSAVYPSLAASGVGGEADGERSGIQSTTHSDAKTER